MGVHNAVELLLFQAAAEQWVCRICIVVNYSFAKIGNSSLNAENVT